MDIQEELMSKNGIATIKLARNIIKIPVGERIPTVNELAKNNDLAIGTTHNALKTLIKAKAIEIVPKGHLGSFLVYKDFKLLLDFIGIKYLMGAMPLPYTKRYEGLASGLISQMENVYNIPVNLAYMRGAKTRIAMLVSGRYDFAIISMYAAKEYLKKHDDICIITSFGKNSYTSNHVIMFHDKNVKEVKDGMKVGIDRTSIDQVSLAKKICGNKKVKYVEIEYSHIIEHVIKGDIDMTVMNIDEAIDKNLKINYKVIETENDSTTAVLVARNNDDEVIGLLDKIVDPSAVLNIQKQVLENKIQPSY